MGIGCTNDKNFTRYLGTRTPKISHLVTRHRGNDLAIGLDLGTNKLSPLEGKSLLSPILFS